MNPRLPSLSVLGVHVAKLRRTEALAELVRLHDGAEPPALVAFVNAHTLNLARERPAFRDLLNRAALVLNDGAGLELAARVQGERFPENLNGTDLTPRILELCAERGWRVFFYGAKPGVAAEAAEKLRHRFSALQVAGVQDGYHPREALPDVLARIRTSGASVLVTALGNPLQENWLEANLATTGCRLGIGVGAFLDFAAGRVVRAPEWLQALRLEWAYRMAQEPGRLWRRYVVGNPAFIARVLWERVRG